MLASGFSFIILQMIGVFDQMNLLYCLSGNVSNRYRYAVMDHEFYQCRESTCPICGRSIVTPELLYWPPRMRLEGGRRYPDLLTISIPFAERTGLIVSDRALAAFQDAGITGFSVEPLDFSDPDAPRYHYLTVIGSVSLDYRSMHLRKKNFCGDCGSFVWSRQRIVESVLDHRSWDGSDLCRLEDYPNLLLCTERVIAAIRQNHLKGFTIRSDSEIFLPLKAVKIC